MQKSIHITLEISRCTLSNFYRNITYKFLLTFCLLNSPIKTLNVNLKPVKIQKGTFSFGALLLEGAFYEVLKILKACL